MLAIFFLALQVLVGNSLSPGELRLSSVSEELVAGRYTSPFRSGVVFAIKSGSFHVTDLNNNTIVSVDALGENCRLIEIKRGSFVQERRAQDNSDYYVAPEHVRTLRAVYHKNGSARVGEILSQVRRLDRNASLLQQSLSSLVADPGFALLPFAARDMGEKGLTGVDYPILLPFYATTMKLSKLPSTSLVVQRSAIPFRDTGSEFKHQNCTSYNTCPPCQENYCLGMCGNGCHCWHFVCGDCCYHQGCYDHDICCDTSYFKLSCLFPFSFSCDSYLC